MSANSYSRQWFDTFLGRIDPSIVEGEVAFLKRQLGGSQRVVDLCCGPGRHARPLSDAGFDIIGLDFDAVAIRNAADRAPNASMVRGDMRFIPLADAAVDAVICMWQSFGHFDPEMNRQVLAEMARVLAPNGGVILDLYHREFHASRVGERVIERDGERVHERRVMRGDLLTATLRYESTGLEEEFAWHLYSPEELEALSSPLGLRLRLACAEFDERTPASGDHARMQIVFTS
jgi:SAM-dependent methyltransferase